MKEREAIQTIMEDKIKAVVQNVVKSASDILKNHPEIDGSGSALTNNLQMLQKLVNASIAALRNASSSVTTRKDSMRSADMTVSSSQNQNRFSHPNIGHSTEDRQKELKPSPSSLLPLPPPPSLHSHSNSLAQVLPVQQRRAEPVTWGQKDEYYNAGDAYRR